MIDDLILNQLLEPTYEEIEGYMDEKAKVLWNGFNDFVSSRFGAARKTAYSKCSGKPGWNVKYRKSGKSLCTLYPEKNGFIVLVVILLEMIPAINAIRADIPERILQLAESAAPFNGTKWLMIPVYDENDLCGVKTLLLLKHGKPEKSS